MPPSPNRSQSSVALEAAATAAQKTHSPNWQPPSRSSGLENIGIAVSNAELRRPVLRTSSTKDVELAAAKASVQRSNTLPIRTPRSETPPTDKINISRSPSSTKIGTTGAKSSKPSIYVDNRGTIAASAAMLSSKSVASADAAISHILSTSQQPSTQAARSVSNKQLAIGPPIPEADREARFGVILSRSVSPAPDRRESPPEKASPKINGRSFYQLPGATVSEPIISSKSFEIVKTHRSSPLVPLASRPRLNGRDSSSGGSSVADVGAAIAMSSKNSSATSLPNLTGVEHFDSGTIPVARRRPVHLKTTMRKESRPGREKNHVHAGPQSVTEVERKRYEGVWASNHCQEALPMLSEEHNYIHNLIVRELWMRSNLPSELLGHIW